MDGNEDEEEEQIYRVNINAPVSQYSTEFRNPLKLLFSSYSKAERMLKMLLFFLTGVWHLLAAQRRPFWELHEQCECG